MLLNPTRSVSAAASKRSSNQRGGASDPFSTSKVFALSNEAKMFSANGTRRVVHYKAEPSVRDIMMSSPISLQRDNKLSLAEDVMAGGRIRHVPILDGE